MNTPRPEAGLVVAYSYLWHREAAQGREEGIKDRPCAVVLVVTDKKLGRERALLLPITHRAPADTEAAVEIPIAIKRRLGLASNRSWIVVGEWNECLWPSPDLRRTSRQKGASAAYGFLPPRFFDHVRERFVLLIEKRKALRVRRSE